jgi:hypothetical protein
MPFDFKYHREGVGAIERELRTYKSAREAITADPRWREPHLGNVEKVANLDRNIKRTLTDFLEKMKARVDQELLAAVQASATFDGDRTSWPQRTYEATAAHQDVLAAKDEAALLALYQKAGETGLVCRRVELGRLLRNKLGGTESEFPFLELERKYRSDVEAEAVKMAGTARMLKDGLMALGHFALTTADEFSAGQTGEVPDLSTHLPRIEANVLAEAGKF